MKRLLILLVVFCLMLLCGCSDYREIDRGYIVTAIGATQQTDKINIIIETLSSSDVSDEPSERLLLSGEGDSLENAISDLNAQLVKPLYFEHLGTIVLQENFSKSQQEQIIDFFKNSYNVSYGVYLIKTEDVKVLFEMQTHNGVLGYDIIGLIKNFQVQNDKKTQNQIYQYERQKNTNLPAVTVVDGKLIFETSGEK